MFKHIVGTALVVSLAVAGTASAGPVGWQQPYFTYSPGAVDFEDIEWTPLEFAAFSAYGGYFANIRRPRFETPLPQLFFQDKDFGLEDELKIQMNVLLGPTFLPQEAAFSSLSLTSGPEGEQASVPEPGVLALIGVGLLAASRTVRRRFAR